MNDVCKISHITGELSPILFANSIVWVFLRPFDSMTTEMDEGDKANAYGVLRLPPNEAII